ncbi:MAG: nucleotidyltransferase domain-containing protein [Labilibaculum sp.]|nr:nucleotidyltransferase domain-containing protein [Labilibaculum sp.]
MLWTREFSAILTENNSIFIRKLKRMTSKEYILSEMKRHKDILLNFRVVKVGLFGSYVRGQQSNESDIDILIEFESGKENFDNYMSVYDLFENIFKNEKVEIVTKNGLSRYIGPQILKEVAYT